MNVRISEYSNGNWGIWVRGVVFTLTQDELESLFDRIGMALTGLTDLEIQEALDEGR